MIRLNSKLPTGIALAGFLFAGAGCAEVEPTKQEAPTGTTSQALIAPISAFSNVTAAADSDVQVSATEIGPNRYIVVATATLGRGVGAVWATFHNFEKLVEIGLPGVVTDFVWLEGAPGIVPSTFLLYAGDVAVPEELYYRDNASYTMRYRLLQPALGFVAIDANIQFTPISNKATFYTVTRDVTLEPGVPIEGFVGLTIVETQNVQGHFAKKK
jgi:hypothetical protein